MNNEKFIKYIFERSNFINTKYMSNMILISNFETTDNSTRDVVIYKDGGVGVYEDFSELVNGKIAGGFLEEDDWQYYGLVIFTGEVLKPPKWKIIDWIYGYTDRKSISIKTEDIEWYDIGEYTNWKPVLNND